MATTVLIHFVLAVVSDEDMIRESITYHSSRFTLIVVRRRYGGNYRVRTSTCRDQLLSMALAQLTFRESLREIAV